MFYGKISSLLPFGLALPPIRATIEVTYTCNLCCKMCYQKEERKRKGAEMELNKEEIKKIIDQMFPRTLITLTGGEILVKEYAQEIIEYAGRRHYCNIVTNGSLFTKKIVRDLLNKNLLVVGVSLDGIGGVHNKIRGVKRAFEKAVLGIRLIQKEKLKKNKKFPLIDIKTVILPENMDQLYQLYKLAEKLKVDFFTVSVLKSSPVQLSPPILDLISDSVYKTLPTVRERFDVELLQKEIKKINKERSMVKVRFYPGGLDNRLEDYYQNRIFPKDYFPCYFPWMAFNLSPYGDVFPCIALNVGNINKQRLWKIWNGKKMRQFRLKLKKEKVFPVCQGCCNLWLRKNEKN